MARMSDDLRNLGNNLIKMVNAQKLNALNAGKKQAIKEGADEANIVGNRYLNVSFNKRGEAGGVIDLKKSFEHGAGAKQKKNGGWYTKVPIQYGVSQMSNRTYDEVRDLGKVTTSTTYIDILYGGQPLTDDALTSFGITTRVHGGNLTRVTQGATRGSYFAFRTVSDRSKPDSWLLLKDMAKAQAEEHRKLRRIGEAIQATLEGYGKDNTV